MNYFLSVIIIIIIIMVYCSTSNKERFFVYKIRYIALALRVKTICLLVIENGMQFTFVFFMSLKRRATSDSSPV